MRLKRQNALKEAVIAMGDHLHAPRTLAVVVVADRGVAVLLNCCMRRREGVSMPLVPQVEVVLCSVEVVLFSRSHESHAPSPPALDFLSLARSLSRSL